MSTKPSASDWRTSATVTSFWKSMNWRFSSARLRRRAPERHEPRRAVAARRSARRPRRRGAGEARRAARPRRGRRRAPRRARARRSRRRRSARQSRLVARRRSRRARSAKRRVPPSCSPACTAGDQPPLTSIASHGIVRARLRRGERRDARARAPGAALGREHGVTQQALGAGAARARRAARARPTSASARVSTIARTRMPPATRRAAAA